MEVASKEQIDALCKQVHDLKEMAEKKNTQMMEDVLPKMVEQILASHPGFTPVKKIQFAGSDVPNHVDDVQELMPKALVSEIDGAFLASQILRKPVNELKMWGRTRRKMGDFTKALDSLTAGGGLEWVPTDFSSNLYELVRLQMRVGQLFPIITMPSNPYKLPVQLGRISTWKQDEQIADTGQTKIPVSDTVAISGNVTFTAQGHAARVLCSKEAEEDSIVPVLPFLQRELVIALAEGREDAIINGDTTGTHQDSDTAAIAGHRAKMWKGLRKLANQQSYKQDLSTFNTTNLRALRAQMLKYGVLPSQMAIVVGVKGYLNNLLGLAEVITVDKYGPSATVLVGELAKFDGIPVIVSEWVRENVNASGVYDGATTTKRTLDYVYTNGFALGVRRGASVQVLRELYAESDQDALVVRERVDFEPIRAITAEPITAFGYNF